MKLSRKIYNGNFVEELQNKIELKIITKAPQKWLLIDLETLQMYNGSNNNLIGKQWNKINNKDFDELFEVLSKINKVKDE